MVGCLKQSRISGLYYGASGDMPAHGREQVRGTGMAACDISLWQTSREPYPVLALSDVPCR